ncbi:MAG TPA: SdrD B-like domain-containing protein [Lacipirellula sp.]
MLQRRPAFEWVEPRLLFSADGLTANELVGDEPPVIYLPGAIAGTVYAVGEVDGATPSLGTGISGVRLELLSHAGEVLAEAITDDEGAYQFPALEPGVYAIRQTQPAGLQDGAAVIGSGGGTPVTASFVIEIVVQPGAALAGYDFVELLEPTHLETVQAASQEMAGFVPPLVVSWSRPPQLVGERVVLPIATATLPAALPAIRPPEPIFGGSSDVIDEESVKEAFSDAEFIEQVAQSPESNSGEAPNERVAMKRGNPQAQDRVFELDVETEDDGRHREVSADVATPMNHSVTRGDARQRVVVRKPAA